VNELFFLLAAAAAAVVWWRAAKPPALFVVRIRQGKPMVARGKVTEAFLAAVFDVIQDFGVASAEIRGVPQDRRISLWFSPRIPSSACQRLRNWWAISGWPSRPNRG
jgi:hypothetical protein